MSYTFNPFTGNLDVTPFSLDGAGKIPSNYLPSYVDDVVEYDDLAGFPGTGETGKIYVAKDTGYTYRWTGSVYVRIGSGGEVGLNLGSEGSPSLFFNGDANTGLYSPGADQVGISTNGTGRLFVDANGRVNVGQLSGTGYGSSGVSLFIKQYSAAIYQGLVVESSADGSSVAIGHTGSVAGISAYYGSSGSYAPLAFFTSNTERVRIDSSGNVGVRTSFPSEVLDVNGTIRTYQSTNAATFKNNQLRADSSGAFYFDHGTVGQPFNFRVSNASALDKTALTISSSGNVGIGNTSPASTLDLNGSFTHRNSSGNVSLSTIPTGIGGGTTYSLGATDGSGNLLTGLSLESGIPVPGVRGGIVRTTSSSAPALSFKTATTSSALISFDVNGTERARIDSSGNVGIGTTAPGDYNSAANNLVVLGSTNTGLTIASNSATGGSNIYFARGNASSGSDSRKGQIRYDHTSDAFSFVTAATERLRIDSSGNVGIGTTSPAYTFDCRGTIYSSVASGTTNYLLGDATNGTQSSIRTSNGNLIFSANAVNESFRVDSSSRLLVGTSSGTAQVAAKFQARAGTPEAQGTIMLSRGTANPTNAQTIGEILFTDSNEGRGAKINAVPEASWAANDYPTRLGFFTTAVGGSGPTERMRITSDAYVRLASGTGGIQFNGDTAAANALDDYEEGTWTPTLNWTGVTYTVQSGYYTKIGNTVHVHATITWTVNDVASATVISGLPFATTSVTDIGAIKINDVAVPATLSYNSVEAVASSLYVRYINTSGASINYPVAANDAGAIYVNCVYKAA